jgi:uncharacterized protein (DUF697 family)
MFVTDVSDVSIYERVCQNGVQAREQIFLFAKIAVAVNCKAVAASNTLGIGDSLTQISQQSLNLKEGAVSLGDKRLRIWLAGRRFDDNTEVEGKTLLEIFITNKIVFFKSSQW